MWSTSYAKTTHSVALSACVFKGYHPKTLIIFSELRILQYLKNYPVTISRCSLQNPPCDLLLTLAQRQAVQPPLVHAVSHLLSWNILIKD